MIHIFLLFFGILLQWHSSLSSMSVSCVFEYLLSWYRLYVFPHFCQNDNYMSLFCFLENLLYFNSIARVLVRFDFYRVKAVSWTTCTISFIDKILAHAIYSTKKECTAIFIFILCFHYIQFNKLSQKVVIIRPSVSLPRFVPIN